MASAGTRSVGAHDDENLNTETTVGDSGEDDADQSWQRNFAKFHRARIF